MEDIEKPIMSFVLSFSTQTIVHDLVLTEITIDDKEVHEEILEVDYEEQEGFEQKADSILPNKFARPLQRVN